MGLFVRFDLEARSGLIDLIIDIIDIIDITDIIYIIDINDIVCVSILLCLSISRRDRHRWRQMMPLTTDVKGGIVMVANKS